jgi:hypothetical protein
MIVKVHNISKSPIPIIFENVLQIDYIHYDNNEFVSEYKSLVILYELEGVMYRQNIDITPDIQITILEVEEE